MFTPNAVGPFSATVSLSSNASNAPETFAVGGTGTASAVGTLAFAPAGLHFGSVEGGLPVAGSIVVTNIGGAPVQLGYVGVGGATPADFTPGAGCNGLALAPTQSCSITVTFQPLALGARSATLTIPSDASNGPTVVALDGLVLPRQPPAPIPALAPVPLVLLAALLALGAFTRRRTRSDSPKELP